MAGGGNASGPGAGKWQCFAGNRAWPRLKWTKFVDGSDENVLIINNLYAVCTILGAGKSLIRLFWGSSEGRRLILTAGRKGRVWQSALSGNRRGRCVLADWPRLRVIESWQAGCI